MFLWTTGLGILPLTVLSVTLGDGLVTASGQAWALIAFGAVALTFAVQRWRRRAAARKPWP